MADVSVTAASVVKTANTAISEGIAGGTVTAGMPVYIDTTDSSKLKAADCDVQATSVAAGIALHGASAGQPLKYATSGNLTFNAGFTVGVVYVVSTTAGGIAPDTDLVSGDYVTILGIATTTSNLNIKINASEIAKP